MAHTRKFRFGVQTGGLGLTANPADYGRAWADLARRVEALGYSSLSLPDHFDAQLAPLPALAAAAAATTTLKVGCAVWCNDYKHPVVLAKEVATLDLLSGGRVQLGLGAGWMRTDYESAGLEYASPGLRIERLAEAIQVIKGLHADGPFSFQGSHYTVRELDAQPKPIQKPHPPLYIGGGAKKMLSLAAREADIVGVNVDLHSGVLGAVAIANTSAEATRQKVEWIRDAAGERYASIELNVHIHYSQVTDQRLAAFEKIQPQFGLSVSELQQNPHVLVGSVDEIVADLESRREHYDMSYIVVRQDVMEAFAPVVARLAGH